MQKFTLTINTRNAAFDGEYAADEVARILRELADAVEDGVQFAPARDVNGNEVGSMKWK